MQWRYSTQSLDRLHPGMFVRNLSRKVNFGSGSGPSGYQNAFRIFPLIIGAAALTTLLVGSFLWGYVSRKHKKERENSSPLKELYPHASHKANTVVTLHDVIKASPSPRANFSNRGNDVYFDTLVFDPQQDYAQVLAEARSHATATQISPVTDPPVANSSKLSWLIRSSSARRHNPIFEDQAPVSQDRFKSSKSWKKLLFWKRSKRRYGLDYDINVGVYSSCNTPMHHTFMSSKTRATVAPTTPTHASNRKPINKRSTSGPVYSDGIPYAPNRNSRTGSGPLSGSATPARDGLIEPTYIPLKKHGGNAKVSSGPLYVS